MTKNDVAKTRKTKNDAAGTGKKKTKPVAAPSEEKKKTKRKRSASVSKKTSPAKKSKKVEVKDALIEEPTEVENIPEPLPVDLETLSLAGNDTADTELQGDIDWQESIETQQVVGFSLGEQMYGVPVQQVIEALRLVSFTVLPEAPPGILGVINFRGEVIPLIYLREILGFPLYELEMSTPILVVKVSGRMLGLVVDEVEGVGAVPLGIQTPSDYLSTDVEYISAVARLDQNLLLIIDLDELRKAIPSLEIAVQPA